MVRRSRAIRLRGHCATGTWSGVGYLRFLTRRLRVLPPPPEGPRGGRCRLENRGLKDGVLLFHVSGGPFITEFRLLGKAEAVVGAALHKLPQGAFSGYERSAARSAAAHQVRLLRQT